MTLFFISRIVGLVVFSIVGIRIGNDLADFINLAEAESAFIFFWVGALFGLTATPWITVAPVQRLRRAINEMPVPKLIMSAIGGMMGLVLALMLAFPLSLLERPIGDIAPAITSVIFGYLGMAIFGLRATEIVEVFAERFGGRSRQFNSFTRRQLLLDTSVLIDGRIVEIAETGFVGGTLVIPRFVLSELHRVADSPDPLRRNRGRRGLAKLNELQRNNDLPVKIIEDDPLDFTEVDAKLVALAIELNASLMTNDFNLNQVADAQGVDVLNINALANAVRAGVYSR